MQGSVVEVPRVAGPILKRFAADGRGGVAIWFALSVIPVTIAVGSMFDYSRATAYRSRLQQATDAAVLAGAQVAPSMSDADLKAFMERYLRDAMGDQNAKLDMTVSPGRTKVRIETSGVVEKTFTKLFDRFAGNSLPIPVRTLSATIISNSTYEIVMVLDNSGSMYGDKIKNLKVAAGQLVDTMFASTKTAGRVKVGLVPFTLAVNVGSQFNTASWIDTKAKNPLHWQNFTRPTVDGTPGGTEIIGLPTSRFDLFTRLGQTWGGCVEQRTSPLNVQDTPPDPANPATLFIPMFAPDEPDNFSSISVFPDGKTYKRDYYPKKTDGTSAYTGRNYNNNYLADFGGICAYNNNDPYRKADVAWARGDNQSALCKYTPTNWLSSRSSSSGPNYQCNAQPIVELTDQSAKLKSSINSMQADGNTDLVEGMMWGWRVLSPEPPFTEGKAWDEPSNYKVIIFMTDGENFLNTDNSYENRSTYSPFGYLAKSSDRLGITSGDDTAARNQMDVLTKQACSGVKEKKIQVYTIALGVTDANNLAMLRDCATRSDMSYSTSSSSNLIRIFQEIAASIGTLRLTD